MALSELRTLFLPFTPGADGSLPASASYAIALASTSGAHLKARVYGMIFDAPFTVAPGFVGSLSTSANEDEAERMKVAEAAFAAAAAAAGIKAEVSAHQTRHHLMTREMVGLARLSDLVIVDDAQSFLMLGRALIEEALFNTGRPALIVPQATAGFSARKIMIAWDHSSRAIRSVFDAMPFLTAAESVEVVSVINEKELAKEAPGSDLAQLLHRHGVKAKDVTLAPHDRDAAKALRDHAQMSGAEMIVMGAYAHSWFRQLVWGGFTNAMLEAAPAPVFMSH
jgi:nucleotide-binding universal stress UspA family protein